MGVLGCQSGRIAQGAKSHFYTIKPLASKDSKVVTWFKSIHYTSASLNSTVKLYPDKWSVINQNELSQALIHIQNRSITQQSQPQTYQGRS